jgi:regulator of RNase E activity RraA
MNQLHPPEQIAALREIDSPTIANAIEAFKVRDPTDGFASMELRCQFADLPPMVGYAVTCTIDSTSPLPSRPTRLSEFFDAVQAAPRPSIVVMQHVGPSRERSCVAGDVLCTSFQRLGAAGLVTDAGVRDLSGVRRRAQGFQVFAPGAVVSHGTGSVLEIGGTVTVCGLVIRTGDLLHGNESGLVKVPPEVVEPVLSRAREVAAAEAALFEFLQSEDFSLAGLKRSLFH